MSQVIDGPDIGGEFDCTPDSLAVAAEDFGHIVHRAPAAVYRPGSVVNVGRFVRWAERRGHKIAVRGRGHSIYGRASVRGGIVIEMSTVDRLEPPRSDGITVDAGATWRSVVAATLPHSLTPPVLPNYFDLSVGGTLSVGGIGGTTSRHGMLTDNVLALEVVTGDGRQVTCSHDNNPELFDAARAGLGHCAVIVKATLKLMPAPERVRRYQLFYGDLRHLIADQTRALADDRFDSLQGAIVPGPRGDWAYQLEGAVFHDAESPPGDDGALSDLSDDRPAAKISDMTYSGYVNGFDRLEAALRASGQWQQPHPWLLTFLPASAAEQVAKEILAGIEPSELGPFGQISFYPISTAAQRTPLMRMPAGKTAFVFNLIRMPDASDAARVDRMLSQNRSIYERIRKTGGVLYPPSALQMSRGDWQRHFGEAWQALAAAKRQFDPKDVFKPGYETF